MGVIEDLAAEIMGEAGKTGTESLRAAKGAVLDAIDAINVKLNAEVLKDRISNIAVTAGAKTITIPKAVKTIREIGEYSASAARIIVPWNETTEKEFLGHVSGMSSLSSNNAGDDRWWFMKDFAATRDFVIGLYPACLTDLVVEVQFYVALTDSNADRLDDRSTLKHGAKAFLSWFKGTQQVHYNFFVDGIEDLRHQHISPKRSFPSRQKPSTAAHNAAAATFV